MNQKVIITMVIGLAFTSQLATAGSITDTYATGDTLTVTKMDTIKAAVNDNDDRVTNLEKSVINLQQQVILPDCGSGTEDQRFVVSQDNTEACDNTTGLHWELSRSSGGGLSHSDGVAHCINLDLGNGHSYRLPEVKDLISLVDYRVPSFGSPPVGSGLPIGFLFPAIHPFIDVLASTYWSASLNTANFSEAYFVTFNTGEVILSGDITSRRHVWCVR